MKPKANRTGKPSLDQCQTPAYAIRPLLPYLRKEWLVWEPACGKGYMMGALYEAGLHVIGSDILGGHDFFYWQPDVYDCIVTNPPYSIKPKWLGRCYDLGKPFALLMPVEFIGTKGAQTLFRQHGIEVIWLSERINFEMPEKGFDGAGAQFPVAWYCWGLNIGQQMTFYEFEPSAQMRIPGL